MRGLPGFENLRDIGEFMGHESETPELPYPVAKNLSQCLTANPASSEVLMKAGVFPVFELNIKDPNAPDLIVELDGFTYEAWLTKQDIIVSKHLNDERSVESKVWGYFRN